MTRDEPGVRSRWREAWRRGVKAGGVAVGATAVAWLLLFAAITVALTVPATAHLALPSSASVSMTRPFERFRPLSEQFIHAALGLVTARPVEPDVHAPVRAPLPRPEPPVDAGRPPVALAPVRQSAPLTLSHAFGNDDFASAYQVQEVPFQARTQTHAATREPDEPSGCGVTGGTGWYRYTPDANGAVFANTFGSNYALALAVYTGERLADLRLVACDTSPVGNAQAGVKLAKEQRYYFQVTGLAGGGDLVFNLEPVGRVELASVSSSGERGDAGRGSAAPVVSGDGRYVAFHSSARNLDAERRDPGQVCKEWGATCIHVYLHDRETRTTELISRSSSGTTGNSSSYYPSISADGRYVAYLSYATNLVLDDTNGIPDVFVFDRVNGTTTRESVSSSRAQANARIPGVSGAFYGSGFPHLSADGRYLSFGSDAENLVPGRSCDYTRERANCWQVYLRDRLAGTTALVSIGGDGTAATQVAHQSAVSADGRRVVFASYDGDTTASGSQTGCARQNRGGCNHVYVRDLVSRTTTLVDAGPSGPGSGSADANTIAISADGRFVSFVSDATNLVEGDTNESSDVFVRDLETGRLERVSVSSSGEQGSRPNRTGYDEVGGVITLVAYRTTSLSADGRYVAFESAHALVPGDTNGLVDIFVRDRKIGTTVSVSVSSTGEQGRYGSSHPRIADDGRVVVFISSDDFDGAEEDIGGVWVHERAAPPGREQ